jgi:hypothetical protein
MSAETSRTAETPKQKLADRVRVIGVATALAIVLGCGLNYLPFDDLLDRGGIPWGGDFPTYYIAGSMAAEGDLRQLYDAAEHQRRIRQLFPGISPLYCLPYRYPPMLAAVMAPMALLSYAQSSTLFALVSVALILGSIALLMRTTGLAATNWRSTAWWGAVTAPVVLEPIIGGQLSPVALMIVAATVALLHGGRQSLAGAVLALSLFKPNVLALFGVVCVLRYPRMLLGAVPVGLVWLAANVMVVGVDGTLAYLHLGSQLALDEWSIRAPAHKLHGLAAWWQLMASGRERELTLALGTVSACWVAYRWHKAKDDGATFWIALSLALTINALGNPYVPIYDLALLMPGALLMTAGLICRYGPELNGKLLPAQVLIGCVYFGPHLSQAVAAQWGVQLFPLLLAAIGIWQARALSRACTATHGSLTSSSATSPAF